jgi:hypothetical protein
MFKGFAATLPNVRAELLRALKPGISPAPTLPPARADSFRNFLLLVDMRFSLLDVWFSMTVRSRYAPKSAIVSP